MRRFVWLVLLLGASFSSGGAQQSGKAVAVSPGPGPASDYVWATINGLGSNPNSVALRHTDGTAVINPGSGAPVYLTGALFGFNRPYDILGVPSLHRVFVTNGNAVPGTVTVVDSETLKALAIVTVPGSLNLRGMSLSEDESAVFVAGQDPTAVTGGPAVWRIDPTTLAVSFVGSQSDPGRGAEDCVVIRAANVGGSGNGPGKIYFTSFTGNPTSFVGVINLLGPSPAPIRLAQGALLPVDGPTNVERTPDHRAVFVCCRKSGFGFGTNSRILRINTSDDSTSLPVSSNGIQDLLTNRSMDVSWHVDAGGTNRGFLLVNQDNSTQIQEILDDGTMRAMPFVSAGQGGLSAPTTIRYFASTEQVYIGELAGTSNAFNIFAAKDPGPISNPPPPVITQLGVGTDPLNFAMMKTPAPVISDICPRAGPAGSSIVTVYGTGFRSGLTALVGATPVPANVLDANTLSVDLSAIGVGSLGLRVDNTNFLNGSMDTFYRNYAPPAFRYPATAPGAQIALPTAAQGYRMLSFPQYATLTAFKAALTAQLGPYNPVLYRVFFYRNGGYVELNQLVDDGCDLAGESFWVLTRNGAILSLTEPDVRQNDAGANRVIPINPGFNMISLPILNAAGTSGTIPWASVHVTSNQTDFNILSPTGPVPATSAAGLAIVDPAIEYVGGSYFLAPNLVAGQGFWVRNITTGPAYLVFQPGLVTKPSGASQAAGVPPPAGSMPPPPPWGMASGGSSGSGGCGLLGLECLILVLARAVFPRVRGHRKLIA